jgi:hypothetical protein
MYNFQPRIRGFNPSISCLSVKQLEGTCKLQISLFAKSKDSKLNPHNENPKNWHHVCTYNDRGTPSARPNPPYPAVMNTLAVIRRSCPILVTFYCCASRACVVYRQRRDYLQPHPPIHTFTSYVFVPQSSSIARARCPH